jgi:hypothetical protein
VLDLVCPPRAVQFRVIAGVRRDDVLEKPELLDPAPSGTGPEWWRLVAVGASSPRAGRA